MGFSTIGAVIGLLIMLPSVVFFTKFPPKNAPAGLSDAPVVYTVLERIGQVGCLSALVLSARFEVQSLWVVPTLGCILIYYGLWLRYVKSGQAYSALWKPFLRIPIPLAVFPVCAFGFAAVWAQDLWLGAATAVLGVGHWAVSWNQARQSLGQRAA